MASLYSRLLAAVLAHVEPGLCPEDCADLLASVQVWLENGVEDENLDVWPAEATA